MGHQVAPSPCECQAHHEHRRRVQDRHRPRLGHSPVGVVRGKRGWPRNYGDEQQEDQRPLQEPPVDAADSAHHPVMLDPQDPDRDERHQVGHVRRPRVEQIVDEPGGVGRLGQVQDQQGQGDGEDAVDERVESAWSQSWSPTSSAGGSRLTRTQATTCGEKHSVNDPTPLNPDIRRAGHTWDGTRSSIKPPGVSAGHRQRSDVSCNGL